jgi:hypothetical protein
LRKSSRHSSFFMLLIDIKGEQTDFVISNDFFDFK